MANDREHFEDYREQTRVKHAILEKYLPAFFHILKQTNDNLVYIDGFAGRGTYTDAESGATFEGSPLRALRLISKSEELAAKVSTFFIERDRKLATDLRATVAAFVASITNLRAPVICEGEFAHELTSALDEIEREGHGLAPTFLFVDPCGVAGTDFSVIQRYLNQRHCETLIFFNIAGVRRILGLQERMGDTLGELLGSAEHANKLAEEVARCNDPEAKEERIVSYYADRLRVTKAKYVTPFRVEYENRRSTSHYLIHATSHPRGFSIMKDVMWSVGKTAEGDGGLALVQASKQNSPHLLFRPKWEAVKADVLRELGSGKRRVSHFYEDLVARPTNLLSETAYRKALLELEAEGELIVLDKLGAAPAPAATRRKRNGVSTLADAYYVVLAEAPSAELGDDEIRPGECLRCSEATPIYTYSCLDCDSSGDEYGGEEAYQEGDLWYLVDHDPNSRGDAEPMKCEFCGSTNIEIEFESMCGYCDHVAGGD